MSYLPLRCEIFLFADLHEFWGKPVGLEGQGALGRLYGVYNDKRERCGLKENYV